MTQRLPYLPSGTLSDTKLDSLRGAIKDTLLPLIARDYYYVDLPYHTNLGDIMIWEGTCEFLDKHISRKCLGTRSALWDSRTDFHGKTVLCHGGGNFGDLYPLHHDYRKKVIEANPDSRIIILPQTVHYSDERMMEKDARFFARFPNVTICTRDKVSHDLLTSKFDNDIRLVPDMAFYIDRTNFLSHKSPIKEGLYMKRLDKEVRDDFDLSCISAEIFDTADWPTIENHPMWLVKALDRRKKWILRIRNRLKIDLTDHLIHGYWSHTVRPQFIREAFAFISQYNVIWSTRLHGVICAMLLDIPVYVVDNDHGKATRFIKTWFSESIASKEGTPQTR